MVVRLAVIGCGSWGMNHVRSARKVKGAELAVVCDGSKEALARAVEAAPGARAVSRLEDALAADVDGVIVATPAPSHAAVAAAAVAAGKHLLVEKPFVLTPADGQRIVEEAEAKKRVLMVGHVLRFHPYFRHLERLVKSGELGKVHYAYAKRVNLGTVRSDENAFWSLAAHDLSMLCALLQSEPAEVAATGQAFLRPGVEDVVFATVRFKNGTLGHIHTSWLDPQKQRELTVVGAKKMAVFDDMQPAEKLRLYDKGVSGDASVSFEQFLSVREGDVHIPHLKMVEPLLAEQQHFVDCIRDGKTPDTDGKDAMLVLRSLVAASESLKAGGRPVSL